MRRSLTLPASGILRTAVAGGDLIENAIAEFVEAQTCAQQQLASEQAQAFLGVSAFIGDMGMSPRGDADRVPALPRIESDVDLVVMEIAADRKCGGR